MMPLLVDRRRRIRVCGQGLQTYTQRFQGICLNNGDFDVILGTAGVNTRPNGVAVGARTGSTRGWHIAKSGKREAPNLEAQMLSPVSSDPEAVSGVGDQTQLCRAVHGRVGGQDPDGVAECAGLGRHQVTLKTVLSALT